MSLIALMGRAKSGKDTIGDLIAEHYAGQSVRLAFAEKLKQLCMDVFGLSRTDVYTEAGKDRETVLPCLGFGADRWTPRMILQHVASALRQVDNDVFVNFTMRAAAELLRPLPPFAWVDDPAYPERRGLPYAEAANQVTTVVITDCRFRVEAEAVWRAGGQVWRVRRPLTDGLRQGIAGHTSETEMDTIPEELFQRVIVNDGSLEDLRAKVLVALPA